MKLKFDFRNYISFSTGKKYMATLDEEQMRQVDIMKCFSQEDRFVLWLTLAREPLPLSRILEDWEDTSRYLIWELGFLFEKGLLDITVKNGIPYYGIITESIDPWIRELIAGLVPYQVSAIAQWYQYTDVPVSKALCN